MTRHELEVNVSGVLSRHHMLVLLPFRSFDYRINHLRNVLGKCGRWGDRIEDFINIKHHVGGFCLDSVEVIFVETDVHQM